MRIAQRALLVCMACLPVSQETLAQGIKSTDIGRWSLPDPVSVERALHESPRMQMAQESIAQGRLRENQLRAGPHEPQVSALLQRRTNEFGRTSSEQEYELQTGVRWPWKRSLDLQLGVLAHEVGELSFTDDWHEAGRSLLDLWYAWLHAELTTRLREKQLEVLRQQRAVVAGRVAAGDAAALDLTLADAEVSRASAVRIQSGRDASLAREVLLQEFPLVPAVVPRDIGQAEGLSEGDAELQRAIIGNSHEIELAEMRRDEALLHARRAAQERLADPSVGLRYSPDIGGDRKVIGLVFSLPLGRTGRATQAELARSEARVAASGAQRTRDQVNANARRVVEDARQSLLSWREADAASARVHEAAAKTERGYSLGEFDIEALLSARRMAIQAEQELLDELMRAEWSHARVLLDAHRLWVAPDHESRSKEHDHQD